MADGAQSGGALWAAEAGPDFRRRVVDKMVGKLAEVFYVGKLAPCQELHVIAAQFEATVFNKANSVQDYIRRISRKMLDLDQQRQQMSQAASGLQQQMQMGCQMQPADAVQAIQGGNSSSVREMPLAASTVALPIRPPSQLQNMQIMVKQKQPDMKATLDHMLSSQPSAFTSMVAPAVQLQPRQRTVQSVETQSQTQCRARQLQRTDYAGCNPTSAPRLQEQPVVRPNAQQIQLLRQNASGIGVQQRQPHLMRMNHQDLMANQHQMDRQRYQMHGAQQASVGGTQIGHPGGRNNQQMDRRKLVMHGAQQANIAAMQIGHPGGRDNKPNAGQTAVLQAPLKACEQVAAIREQIRLESRPMTQPQRQITVGQQSSLPCQSPQTSATMRSAGEVDWREEIFQKITSLKNAYFSELSELDRTVVFEQITNEQFQSLPKEQADQYTFTARVKAGTRSALNFLQLQKSNMPEGLKERFAKYETSIHHLLGFHRKRKARIAEMNTRHQSQNCREPPRIVNPTSDAGTSTGGTGIRPKQQELPADGSISKLTQDIAVRTPPARQENCSDQLVGQAECEVRGGAETPVAKKKPIDRLLDAVQSSSPAALRSFANSVGLKRRFVHATLFCGSPPSGSMDGSCVSFECGAAPESESSGESSCKRQKTQNGNGALLDEIEAANGTLIDTVIGIAGDKGPDGTVIEFCYTAVSLAPSLKSVLTASETSLDMAAKLLVPADYPRSSPVLLGDEGDEQPRKKLSGISGAVDAAFRRALDDLPEPRSIKETARAWELCMRRAVVELAHRRGGVTFSSRYGRWESCIAGA